MTRAIVPANRLVAEDSGRYLGFSYNGLGDRLSQTVDGVTTNYTLDLASGLTQVLDDGTHTYLYGNMRIAQQDSTTTQYFLTDALGSVHQLVDETGVVTPSAMLRTGLAQTFQPLRFYSGQAYGEVLDSASNGGASEYGFAACGLGRMDRQPNRIGSPASALLCPLASPLSHQRHLGR
jgi:hypothetical protein